MDESTRRSGRRWPGVLLLIALQAAAASAAGERPVVVDRVDLPAELGRPLPENTLKLFRAAVDGEARRLLVAGILTPHIAVMDLESDRWTATIDSGLDVLGYKYLATDSLNHLLFIRDGSNGSLTRVDIRTGAVGPRAAVPAQAGEMLCDGERGLVYLLTPESPSLRAYREDTLAPAWSSSEMGTGIKSAVLDPATGGLLILDAARTGPEGTIHRFDPDRREVTSSIHFELPPGARADRIFLDPLGARLVVTLGSGEIRTLAMDGTTLGSFEVPPELELESVALDPDRSRLVVVADERPQGEQVAGLGGHVLVVDLATLETVRDIPAGRKLHSLAVDPLTGIAYLPNADAATVWKVDPASGEVTGLRLGDSAEQVLPLNGGRTLVLNSRLGGSFLFAWDVEARRLETFEAGTWPIPLRAEPGSGRLLVLNAWDGTISVFDPENLGGPRAVIPLDLPAGSTDRLPDLAVDGARRLAFAAYPEHAAVAVADLDRLAPAGVIPVPGAVPGDTGGGPGQLLLGLDPDLDRLLVVEPARGRVSVFSIDGRELVGGSRFAAHSTGPVSADMVFVDEGRHLCWVGRVELSTMDGAPTGRTLPRGDHIFAVDEGRGLYWAAGVEAGADGPRDVLVALERDTLAEAGAWDLGPADAVHSSYAFVPPDRIDRTRMTVVDLTVYALTAPRSPSGRSR